MTTPDTKPMQGLTHPCNNVTAHRGGVFICQAAWRSVGADSFCMGCPIVKYPASLADTKQSGGVVEARERKATIESAMNMARAFAGRYKNGYWQADGERKFSEAKADFESRLDRLLAALQAGQQPEPASETAPSVQPEPPNPNCPIKCETMSQCSGACDFCGEVAEAVPVGTVQVMGSYKGRPALGCLLDVGAAAQVGDKLYTAPVSKGAVPLSEAADPMNYKGMFEAAVSSLAEISAALGIEEEDAACANGNDLILEAIARKNEAIMAAITRPATPPPAPQPAVVEALRKIVDKHDEFTRLMCMDPGGFDDPLSDAIEVGRAALASLPEPIPADKGGV